MNDETIGTATYSPEDDKIRLYPDARLSPEEYTKVKGAGFGWAPKQKCFFAVWTPGREDLAREMCGDIGDEDKSLVERAEERAERFEGYEERRREEGEQAQKAVSAISDNIPLGQPILIGHHSERHARRDAERIENGMRKAVKAWETAEYWSYRAKGALRAAKYKELPSVRARQIKGLEAEMRKRERTKKEKAFCLKFWQGGLTLKDGTPIEVNLQQAIDFTNRYDQLYVELPLDRYPRALPASQYEGAMSLWSALESDHPVLTVEQARDIAVKNHSKVIAYCDRWIGHLTNRLAYEREMLAESGGTETDQKKPEVGGACACWASANRFDGGRSYIQKVNKVSVTVLENWGNGGGNFTRTIPFDKLSKIMTATEVQAARDQRDLIEDPNKTGFVLRSELKEKDPTASKRVLERNEKIDAMRATLEVGVKVVVAPQLFPTPPDIAQKAVKLADIKPGNLVLEPSAGTGNLVQAMRDVYGGKYCLTVVEINMDLARGLEVGMHIDCVVRGDFLEQNGNLGTFDRIVMNPPFAMGADVKHIQHALKFLKPGGRLVAICANGPRQRALLPSQGKHSIVHHPFGRFEDSYHSLTIGLAIAE